MASAHLLPWRRIACRNRVVLGPVIVAPTSGACPSHVSPGQGRLTPKVSGKTPSPGGPVPGPIPSGSSTRPDRTCAAKTMVRRGRRWWSRVLQVWSQPVKRQRRGSCCPAGVGGQYLAEGSHTVPLALYLDSPGLFCPDRQRPNVPTPPLRARIRIPHLLSRHQTVPALCQNLF